MQISLRKATATRSLRGSPRDKDHDDDDDDDVIPVFGQAKSRCLLFTSHGQLNAAGCSYLPWPLDPQSPPSARRTRNQPEKVDDIKPRKAPDKRSSICSWATE